MEEGSNFLHWLSETLLRATVFHLSMDLSFYPNNWIQCCPALSDSIENFKGYHSKQVTQS